MSNTQKLSFAYVKPAILSDLKACIAPCLLGAPGIGKSTIIESLATETNTKLFKVACNQLATKEDLTGSRIVELKDVKSDNPADKFTQIMFPQTSIAEAIKYSNEHPDENPILYLDEINRVSDDVTSACLSLVTDRRIGDVKLPDNLRLISAGNDEGNVTALDTASITRFSIYHVSADADTFLDAQPDLNYFVRKTIEQNNDYDFIGDESLYLKTAQSTNDSIDDEDFEDHDVSFNDDFESETIEQMAVPRTITYTSNWLNELGLNDIKQLSNEKRDEFIALTSDPSSTDEDNYDASKTVFYQLLVAHSGETTFTNQLFNNIYDALHVKQSVTAPHSNVNAANITMPSVDDQFIETIFTVGDAYDATEFETVINEEIVNNHNGQKLLDLYTLLFFNESPYAVSVINDQLKQNGYDTAQSSDEVIMLYLDVFNDITFNELNVNQNEFTQQFASLLMTCGSQVQNAGYHVINAKPDNNKVDTVNNTIVTLNNALGAI